MECIPETAWPVPFWFLAHLLPPPFLLILYHPLLPILPPLLPQLASLLHYYSHSVPRVVGQGWTSEAWHYRCYWEHALDPECGCDTYRLLLLAVSLAIAQKYSVAAPAGEVAVAVEVFSIPAVHSRLRLQLHRYRIQLQQQHQQTVQQTQGHPHHRRRRPPSADAAPARRRTTEEPPQSQRSDRSSATGASGSTHRPKADCCQVCRDDYYRCYSCWRG
mmetsp:Transcript_6730/g.14780  ORF Transcript_6730/g.14780 Transcript_6730/m.14780 type:complete len:218 (-) Transcript_6730:231-884(-)